MKILFAASEVAPFAKTGGLADVLGALPRAVERLGHECVVILPLYHSIRSSGFSPEPTEHEFEIPIGPRRMAGRLWKSRLPNSKVPVYFVEQPTYYERLDSEQGQGLYQYRLANGRMKDYADNCQRFVFFSRAVFEAMGLLNWVPDVIHAHDWQTGLVPVYLREMYGKTRAYAAIRSLFTIHNLAYQGIFWHWDVPSTGLDWGLFNFRQLEFYGHLNLMKGGIVFADAVNTVSPRYAEEIQTREHGCALDSVLRHYKEKLIGIVNGVDYTEWNPAADPHLVKSYDVDSVKKGKAACKKALQTKLKLPVRPDVPMLAMISRLAEQKGLKLLHDSVDELFKDDVQLVVLGVGDVPYHQFLENLQRQYPQKAAAVLQFDEAFAHQIEAGADIFLMPSRFEPSGLNQLYSLKYGTVPIVRDTGGLHDTVTNYDADSSNEATGFMFKEYTPSAFLKTVHRALDVFRRQPEVWQRIMKTGMTQNWSWNRSADAYVDLYQRLVRQGNLDIQPGRKDATPVLLDEPTKATL